MGLAQTVPADPDAFNNAIEVALAYGNDSNEAIVGGPCLPRSREDSPARGSVERFGAWDASPGSGIPAHGSRGRSRPADGKERRRTD